ncbi:MAG TPA: hypothetical protein VLK82_23845 [Candidatus Tectomicrobia bacterium]|nr:hypothetical protein [Candidatus Tectomicrobia bacterium]
MRDAGGPLPWVHVLRVCLPGILQGRLTITQGQRTYLVAVLSVIVNVWLGAISRPAAVFAQSFALCLCYFALTVAEGADIIGRDPVKQHCHR